MKGICICPNCGAFVDPDDEMCPECDEDITLLSEEELKPNFEPVVVFTTDSLAEAQAIIEFLKDNDLNATYIDPDSECDIPDGVSSGEIPIIVHPDKSDKAEDLIEDYFAFVSNDEADEDEWNSQNFEVSDEEDLDGDIETNQIA
jgi:uncharacterized OB-fold protein